MTAYVVREVDLDIGFVLVEIHLPDNTQVDVNIDITSIATSDDATITELRNALNQLVDQHVLSLIPSARLRPQALMNMLNTVYESTEL